MAVAINYASIPLNGIETCTLGDNSRTAPATGVKTLINNANGAQIERLGWIPLATTTATVIRFWKYDGANYKLLFEMAVPVIVVTAGAVVGAVTAQAADNPDIFPILIPAGSELRATMNDNQTGINVFAQGGGF